MNKLASEIAKREGGKSQVAIGDIREILSIISDIEVECREAGTEGPVSYFMEGALKKLKRQTYKLPEPLFQTLGFECEPSIHLHKGHVNFPTFEAAAIAYGWSENILEGRNMAHLKLHFYKIHEDGTYEFSDEQQVGFHPCTTTEWD